MKSLVLFLSLAVVALAEPPLPFAVYGPPSAQPSHPGGGHGGGVDSKPSVMKLETVVQLPAASGEKYFPAGTTGFNSPLADAPNLLPPSKRVEIIVKPGATGFTVPSAGAGVPQPAGGAFKPGGVVSYPYPAAKYDYPYPAPAPAKVYGPPTTAAPKPTVKVAPYPAPYPAPVPVTKAPIAPKISYVTPKPVPVTTPKPVVPAVVYGPPTTAAPVPTIKVVYPYPAPVPTIKVVHTTTAKPVKPAVVYGPPTTSAPVIAPKITYVTPKPVPVTTPKPVVPAVVYGPPTTAAPVPTIKVVYPYPAPVPTIKVIPPTTTVKPVKPAVVYGPPTTVSYVIPKITHVTPKPVVVPVTTSKPKMPAVVYGPPTVVYGPPAVVYGPPVVPATKTVPTPAPHKAPVVLPAVYSPAGTDFKPDITLPGLLPAAPKPAAPYAPEVTTPKAKTIGHYPAPYPAAEYPYPSAL